MRSWVYRDQAYDCPVVLTLDRLRGRWKTNILWYVWTGTNRFNAMCQELPEVHRAVVARQLKALERDGLISRRVISSKPLHVEYSLTGLGESLAPIIERLADWGERHSEPARQREVGRGG